MTSPRPASLLFAFLLTLLALTVQRDAAAEQTAAFARLADAGADGASFEREERAERIREFMLKGTRHFEKAEFEEALAFYQKADQLSGGEAPVIGNLVAESRDLLKRQRALRGGKSAEQIDEIAAEKYRSGIQHFEGGRLNDARADFHQTWLLKGEYASLRQYIERVAEALKHQDLAEAPAAESRSEGLQMDPEVRLAQAETHLKQGRPERAAEIYQDVLNADPESRDAAEGLADAQKALAEARAQALERERDALMAKAENALDAGDLELAATTYEQALNLTPGDRGAAKGLKKVAAARAEREEALRRAEQEQLEAKIDGLVAQAEDALDADRFDQAEEIYGQVAELDAANRDAAKGLEQVAEVRAEREEALRRAEAERRAAAAEREAAERARTGQIENLLASAEAALEAQDFKAALASYGEVRNLAPENEAARDGVRKATEAAQELEARRQAEAERAEREARIADLLGAAEEAAAQGDHEAAVASYAKVRAIEPDNAEAEAGVERARTALETIEKRRAEEAERLIAQKEAEAEAARELEAKMSAAREAEERETKLRAERESARRAETAAREEASATLASLTVPTREAEAVEETAPAPRADVTDIIVAQAGAENVESVQNVASEETVAEQAEPRRSAVEGPSNASVKREIVRLMRDAEDLYKQGELAAARELWTRVTELDPSYIAAQAWLEQTSEEYQRMVTDAQRREEQIEKEEQALEKLRMPVEIKTPDAARLADFLDSLSLTTGISFSIAEGADAMVNVNFVDKPLHEILDAVLLPKGLKWTRQGDIIIVSADLVTRAFPLSTEELNLMRTYIEEGTIQGLLWGTTEKPLERTALRLDERTAQLIITDSAQNVQKLGSFIIDMRNETTVPIDTRLYTIQEKNGPQIKAILDAVMGSEQTPFELDRTVVVDGNKLIVRDTPANLDRYEEILLDNELLENLTGMDATLDFAVYDLTPREILEQSPEDAQDFFRNAVEMIQTFLYGAEGVSAAREQGRRMWADGTTYRITIIDYPGKMEQVSNFINSLPQLETKQLMEVIFIDFIESGEMASQLEDILGLAGADLGGGTGLAGEGVTRTMRQESEYTFRDLYVRVVRVNENDVNDDTDDDVELILRTSTQSTEVTIQEFRSTYFEDYEIVADEIRPSGGGDGRAKLTFRYTPPEGAGALEQELEALQQAQQEEQAGQQQEGDEEELMEPVISSFGSQNALVVRYQDPADLIEIKKLITQLDKPIPQVSIEVRFVTVNEQRAKEFGSEFAFMDRSDPRNIGYGILDVFENGDGTYGSSAGPTMGPQFGTALPGAVMNGGFSDYTLIDGVLTNFLGNYVSWELTMLEAEGVVSYVNGPHIVVMDGEAATFAISDSASSSGGVYSWGGGTTGGGAVIGDDDDTDDDDEFNQDTTDQNQTETTDGDAIGIFTGDVVMLDVEPEVTSTESIILEIDVYIQDANYRQNFASGPFGGNFGRGNVDARYERLGHPGTLGGFGSTRYGNRYQYPPELGGSTKEVQTRARIQSGGTIVLGGWNGEHSQDITSGVPGLRNVPWVGSMFFSRNYTQTLKTNLLVFLSGKLVD